MGDVNYLLVGCVSHPSSKAVGACLFLGERSMIAQRALGSLQGFGKAVWEEGRDLVT